MNETTFSSRALIKLSSSSLASGLILVLSLPLIAHLYGPEEYGSYMAIMAVVAIYGSISTLRLDLAILSAKGPREAQFLVTGCTLVLFCMTVIAGVLTTIMMAMLDQKIRWPPFAPVLVMIVVFFAGIFHVFRNYTIYRRLYGRTAFASILGASGRSISQVLFGLSGGSAILLLVGDTIGNILAFFVLGRRRWRRMLHLHRRFGVSVSFLLDRLRFVIYGSPSALLDSVSTAVLVPVVALTYSASDAGMVGLAQRILSAPAQIVGSNIADLIHRDLAIHNQVEFRHNTQFIFRWAMKLSVLGVSLVGLMLFTCILISTALLDEEWGKLALVAPLVAIQSSLVFIFAPISRILLVGDGQREKLIYDTLAVVIPLGALLLNFDGDLDSGIMLYTLGHAFCYFLYGIIIWRCAVRMDNGS
jgi:O-antigen/teichoic acid export membrane protein